MTFILLISLLSTIHITYPLTTGYDCDDPRNPTTTIATNQVNTCTHNKEQVISTKIRGQLVQYVSSEQIAAYSCLVSYTRTIFRCGKSWDQPSPGGSTSGFYTMTREECYVSLLTKSLKYKGSQIKGIKIGEQASELVTITGNVTGNGYCTPGVPFTDENGVFHDRPVIQEQITYLVQSLKANVDYGKDRIIFPRGVSCVFKKLNCFDINFGSLFWEHPVEKSVCRNAPMYEVLYDGELDKVLIANETFYNVMSNQTDFNLKRDKGSNICNYPAYSTEIPDLFIFEKIEGFDYPLKKEPIYKQFDFLKHVNSKLVTLSRRTDRNFQELYSDILFHRCMAKYETLKNLLSLAATDPLSFAKNYAGEPGYFAFNRGEVIYIKKCNPVPVEFRQTSLCYNELPVLYNNKEMFLLPTYHLLTSVGTEITCQDQYKPTFFIEGNWVGINRGAHRVSDPIILDPLQKATVNLTSISNGFFSVYSKDQLSNGTSIMEGLETKAVGYNFAKSIRHGSAHDLKLALDQDDTDHVLDSVGKRWGFWKKASAILGSTSVIVLLVVLVCKGVISGVTLVTTARHLWNLFGPSWKLLGCFCTGLTQMLIKRQHTVNKMDNPDIELGEVTLIPTPSKR